MQTLQRVAVVRTTGAVDAAGIGSRERFRRRRSGNGRRRRRPGGDGRHLAAVALVAVTARVAHRTAAEVRRRIRPVRRPGQTVPALRGAPGVHPERRPSGSGRVPIAVPAPPVELFHERRERWRSVPRARLTDEYVYNVYCVVLRNYISNEPITI